MNLSMLDAQNVLSQKECGNIVAGLDQENTDLSDYWQTGGFMVKRPSRQSFSSTFAMNRPLNRSVKRSYFGSGITNRKNFCTTITSFRFDQAMTLSERVSKHHEHQSGIDGVKKQTSSVDWRNLVNQKVMARKLAPPSANEEIVCSAWKMNMQKHRIKSRCDNTRSKGNALLNRLREKGSWKTASGRTIVQELDYAENGTFDTAVTIH